MRQARGRRQGDGGLSAQARRRVPRAQSARASRVVVLRETSRRRCALPSAARVKYGGLGGGERQTQCLILEGVGLLNSVGIVGFCGFLNELFTQKSGKGLLGARPLSPPLEP